MPNVTSQLKTHLVRAFYRRRTFWKRLLPIQRPILIRLPLFSLMVRLDDWAVGARIALKRTYEPHVTAVLQQYLHPGMVIIDIGANIGYYTLLAAKYVGPNGKVLAFEPSSANCALLQQSVQINGLGNVVVMPYAVADRDSMVSYGMDDSNGRIDVEYRSELTPVPAVMLDTLLAHEPRIDLIKMDIEGAEGRALRGMLHLLQTHHPIVCTEFSPYSLPTTSGIAPEAYLDLWRTLDYDLSVIPVHGAWQLRPMANDEIMQYFTPPSRLDHVDLLAVPQVHL